MGKIVGFHGDVLFVEVKEIKGKKIEPVNGYYTVALGEVTGHSHKVQAIDGVDCYNDNGTLYLRVINPTPVIHEEHHKRLVPGRKYMIDFPREFDYWARGIRRVAD